ncbi:hypothetical protein ATZ35_01570 [Enterococcus rotai]|uniref:asparagine synthase (glutamine-hydrolyzing) n=1 Tax=Enterococcus rotai TaxID=118060 RepID=A0A0U2VN15_9ENTE|nr:asparagine synthase-related protein [Enterococcus rotai]ALS35887.1 hypothetical protein ATZ35_01570 [Enterococcus rotai]
MVGIFGQYNKNGQVEEVKLAVNSSLRTNQTKFGQIYLRSSVVKKYEDDKIFFENDFYIVVSDGVLLNSTELKRIYKTKYISEVIILMYEENGENFFKDIRGSYSCSLYDKRKNELFVYTDQLADKKIFYSDFEDSFIFSSRLEELLIDEKVKKNEIDRESCISLLTLGADKKIFYSDFEDSFIFSSRLEELLIDEKVKKNEIDRESCISLLTLGFMLEDRTLLKQVKKLDAGSYIKVKKNKMAIYSYFKFNNEELHYDSIDTIISKMDELFCQAVKLQFEKDCEYNYKHIASLSGGLDSRMVNIVAANLGYNDILNYTFSQTGYMDATIAATIAADLKHEFIFKSLDDANFLYEIDKIANISFGSSIYYGIAHSHNCIEKLNISGYGMIHTGQLGDVIVGAFNKTKQIDLDFKSYSYSKRYIDKLEQISLGNYANDELFKVYNRGINFALNGNFAFQEFTESLSPFCNVDFMQYCLNIPVEIRSEHALYYKWIMKKYPEAAKYKYESINSKITTPQLVIKSKTFIRKIVNKILKILKLPNLFGYNSKNGMNPFDYWYRNNTTFNQFINDYYKQNYHFLELLDDEVSNMAMDLFEKGILVEKMQVLTLLSTLKLKGKYDE